MRGCKKGKGSGFI